MSLRVLAEGWKEVSFRRGCGTARGMFQPDDRSPQGRLVRDVSWSNKNQDGVDMYVYRVFTLLGCAFSSESDGQSDGRTKGLLQRWRFCS